MQTEKRLWLIACAVLIATAAFAVFAGFSIAGMTGKRDAKPSEPQSEEADPFETDEAESEVPVETLPPASESESETEPAEPETLPDPVAGNIHLLSSDDLDIIRNQYSGDVVSFSSGGQRDEQNRPLYLTGLSAELENQFKNVRVFNGDTEKSVSFIFILTAENGRNTEMILNHLLARGIKATFFVDYYYASKNQGLILRMIEEGHEIGNLGYNLPEGGIAHSDLAEQQTDAMDMQQTAQRLFEYEMSKYYFGYEAYSEQSLELMTQMGYDVTFFSVNYPDYNAEEVIDTAAFLSSMKEQLHPNAIYCLHTVNQATVDMLPELLDYITANGYQIGLIK